MPNTYACKLVSNPNVPIFLPRVCTLVLFIILVNATALGLAYPAARQMACTSCSVGISDLKPLTGTSADQLPHTKSRSLATA